MMDATKTPRIRPVVKPRRAVSEAMPTYGLADGVLSFRHGLRARERCAIDRALDILGRYLREPAVALSDSGSVKRYLQLLLAGEGAEQFAVLYLDSQNRAIAFEKHFTGTLTQTSVYPREIVAAAMRHKACSVILAHNHPSGNVTPSGADALLTNTLKSALSLVDVRILDHIIVGATRALSMMEEGLM